MARIRLKRTEEGGKSLAIGNGGDYGCPVFFRDVEALSAHGWECRLLLSQVDVTIEPGDTVENTPLAFLSPEEVFEHLRVGDCFQLWEMGGIGEGVITTIPD